uniref:WASH1 WAHD domain-containing protein n=1 Tax=Plectus sambesii TaxID=2011161 RepID=A0A914VVD7_9BILA
MYSVRLIPPDLRREDAMVQVADALDELDRVVEDVFSRISDRLSTCQRRAVAVSRRTDSLQVKVDQIKQLKKAVAVFSPAKYPDSIVYSNDAAVFDRPTRARLHKDEHLSPTRRPIKQRFPASLDVKAIVEEKNRFYNPQVKRNSAQQMDFREGLGPTPRGLTSVADLLLFNTSLNPYKYSAVDDPLEHLGKIRPVLPSELVEDNESSLGDAPTTIGQRELAQKRQVDPFAYRPELGDVADFDVPDFLPDLPGIASDVSFASPTFGSIAPSALENLPA